MSAAQPKPTETKPSEPSMEEILASIRRIISDDQSARPVAKAAPEAPAPAPSPAPAAPAPEARQPDPVPEPQPAPVLEVQEEEEEEILELSPKTPRDEEGKRQREPHFITDDPVDGDVSFDDTPAPQADVDALISAAVEPPAMVPPVMAPQMAAPPPMPEVPEPDNDRLLSPNTGRMVSSAFNSLANTVLSNNARTLDDLVHEMLRPLIKSWLDENLPTVVERLVRAEIERVARGGR